MQHNNDEKVSLKELRERFYHLRDFEIQNLWQRTSIFAGFIGLLFAGYGYIFLGSSTSDLTVKHAWSCGIAALAIIFSMFWIALAKGAKAWIEIQEEMICEIEEEEKGDDGEERGLGIPDKFRMGKSVRLKREKMPDINLLSMKSGIFSLSKLNILLGQMLLFCWILIGLAHAILILVTEYSCTSLPGIFRFLIALIPIVIPFVVLCGVIYRAESKPLKDATAKD